MMDTHRRILGILYIVSGILELILLLGITSVFTFFAPHLAEEIGSDAGWALQWAMHVIYWIIFVVILVYSIPSIVGGIGLLQKKNWALIVLLIVGCLKLPSFPFGTALGIYTIWVYIEDKKGTP